MAALTQATKLFIIGRLACYDSPSEVQKALKAELGITASLSQIQAYDPTKAQGARLSPALGEIFKRTRKSFLKDVSGIPIANKAVRLRILQKLTDNALTKGNASMASSLLEQAAKEAGEAFSNRHHVNLKGRLDVPTITDQQLRDSLAKYGIQAVLPGTSPAASPSEQQEGGAGGGA